MTPTPDAPGAERLAAAVRGRADVAALVIEARPELGATVYRYAADGTPGPDVWYGSVEEAQTCVARDYPGSVGEWRVVPAAVADAVRFALDRAGPG